MHGLRTAHELPYRDQQQPTENSIGRKEKAVMDLHSNKMMNQMQDMLTACMVGDLSNMSPGYALEYFEDAHYYLIQIKARQQSDTGIYQPDSNLFRQKRHVCPQTTFIGNRNQLYRIRILGQEIQFFER